MPTIDPRQEWATPEDFRKVLFAEFNIMLDAAATKNNALCVAYFGPDNKDPEWRDGLAADWSFCTHCDPGGIIYFNPGFSNMRPWIEKAGEAARNGITSIGMGLGAISTGWFGLAVEHASEIRLLSPRVQFVFAPGIKQSSNPRENALFIFRPKPKAIPCHIALWNWKES